MKITNIKIYPNVKNYLFLICILLFFEKLEYNIDIFYSFVYYFNLFILEKLYNKRDMLQNISMIHFKFLRTL
jgi:hypothetical protein